MMVPTRLSSPDRDRDGADWPHREHGRVLDAGGVRWHVIVMGRGPAVLLVHGPGGGSHVWAELAPRLRDSFTVVIPDLPGHGFTPHERGWLDPASIATRLGVLLEALGVRPALVVSHSGGLAVAARFANTSGASSLALAGIAPAYGLPPNISLGSARPMLGELFAGEAGVSDRFVARFLAALARRPGMLERFLASSGSASLPSSVRWHRALASHPGHVAAALAWIARADRNAVLEDVRALSVPLLLLVGERDAWISAHDCAELEEASRRGLTVRLADAAHFPQEEQPATVARYLREFAGALGIVR